MDRLPNSSRLAPSGSEKSVPLLYVMELGIENFSEKYASLTAFFPKQSYKTQNNIVHLTIWDYPDSQLL
ncbi:hypothetical protein [uncultured Eudoraea sp.]|uniref:hypothetical protein n=1 Tax=uncultured Eudoraea sp. TaxID=1035614 RepID=UPI00262AF76B|nr:hypothetical protein [uncultured Eudoraea sp.]